MAEINYINGYEIADAKAREDASEALENTDRINYVDAELQIEKLTRQSTDANLQTQINSLASGSPKGVYATAAALKTANPETGVYIVSANGHIYAWTKDQSGDPVDLGVYQATGIADESISFDNLKSNLKNAIKLINVENSNPVLNKIINTSNIEFTLNGYDHTEEIELKAGESINVETLGDNRYVSVISSVSVDTTDTKSYTNRARMINDNSYHEYSYTANINETVIVSYKHNELKNLFISKNYNLDMINSKENYYFKNQYNLINSNDYFLKNSNVTTEIIDNNDVVYNKVLRVNLNYTSVVANYKYNLLKRFTIPNGTIIKNGYCYIDVKKISGDNVPCYLGIFNGTYGALRWKKITISNNEYERIYLPFYDVNNLTNNFPLYFGFYLNKNQLPEITSITSQLEIKEMGIVFNKKFYNTQENLFTPYDIMEMVQNKIEENTDNYKNALISIIGDSYSTYGGFIPDNYPAWYSDSGNTGTNNVNNVNQTWWYKLIKNLNASLLVNCSYSGSTICNTGYDGNYVPSSSFVGRMKTWMGEQRKTDTKPNVIFILGGLNDTWAGSPVGEVKYSNWSEDDLKSVLPAFCYMIDYLQKWNPGVKIINITSPDVSSAIRNGMNTACLHYDIKNIVVSSITKESGHPNQTGMSEIETAILSAL